MVETTIVLPLLLMIVFAIAELGLMFQRWVALNNAVREGAREAVLFRNPCDATQVETDVDTKVQSFAASAGVDLTAGQINVTNQCTGRGNDTTVDATYTFTFQVLPGFASGLDFNFDLSAQTVMRNE